MQRHSEPSKAPAVKTFPVPKVEPRHQPQETFANPDEILEVTFGSHRAQEQTQTNKVQIDRPMVDADESSTGNLQPETSGERSTEPDRGRGGGGVIRIEEVVEVEVEAGGVTIIVIPTRIKVIPEQSGIMKKNQPQQKCNLPR